MIEITGDIFEQKDADAICVTTNGIVNNSGEIIMGAGIAKVFRDKYSDTEFGSLASNLGIMVKKHGNHVFIGCHERVDQHKIAIVSFPTKEHYNDKSTINLIVRSANELVEKTNKNKWKKVVLPRPGCGLGGLNWEEVKPHLEEIFDDRFYVVNK
jgi:O-acetyl-ADP-ribose deacetylase (regulator of RNase III)